MLGKASSGGAVEKFPRTRPYFFLSPTVLSGWRSAVNFLTKRPVDADRQFLPPPDELPPEPLPLAISPPSHRIALPVAGDDPLRAPAICTSVGIPRLVRSPWAEKPIKTLLQAWVCEGV